MGATGKSLILLGVLIMVIGIIVTIFTKFQWSWRLPGDIYIKRENFTLFLPITSSILISIVVSIILWIFRK